MHIVYISEMADAICAALAPVRAGTRDVILKALGLYWTNRRAFVMEMEDVEIVVQSLFGPDKQISSELGIEILDLVEAAVDGKIPWERMIAPAYVSALSRKGVDE